MGMVIHDDFWAAAQAMPEKQRAPFIYAIVEYRFTGKEPAGHAPRRLPTFLVLKGRLDMGDEKSERARKAANARWGNRPGKEDAVDDAAARAQADAQAHAGAYADTDAVAHAQADADAHAGASSCGNAEVEVEVEYIDNPLIPFDEIVHALNEAAGTRYRSSSAKTRRLIHARWAEATASPTSWPSSTRWQPSGRRPEDGQVPAALHAVLAEVRGLREPRPEDPEGGRRYAEYD